MNRLCRIWIVTLACGTLACLEGAVDPTPEGATDPDGGTQPASDASIAVADAAGEDQCPDDPDKTEPGDCGCGVPEGTCDDAGGECASGLGVGERRYPGEPICSPDGSYRFGLQDSGDLVLLEGDEIVWSAGTCCGTAELVMQGDGNLVVYDGGEPQWASDTHGNPGATLALEDSGRTAVSYNGVVLWAVGGGGGGGGGDGISHVGTTEVWDGDGQNMAIDRPAGSIAGDLLVLALHRTDDDLPLYVDGWTRVAECYKRSNGYDCSTEADCTEWHNDDFCQTFGNHGGHDLAQAIFHRTVGSDEPSSYEFDLNTGSSGHPGWAILTALRGAETTDPARDWSYKGCDGDSDSVFPSVYGEAGDMVLLSQSFDDAVARSKFGAPTGTEGFGYVSNSDEAGFLFGGILTSTGETGTMETRGDGASSCKDALVSLTIKPRL